ncbi:uncharacterized protein FIBRA_02405 [Fibroporia radiculosa]|uniref:Protein BFR2 n=1 Tax=Fibroporia radiculosa TaxID=599839 RepID=J4GMV2_9APHY|nr:uncharacterized protein FIBRA_02405 [Fibroporia radiculosa]CCM00375.1 predicted protein [Fibroporia radiculosa]
MPRLSLAQQLAELSEPAPVDLDPEDLRAGVDVGDASAIDNPAATEHYVEVAPSAIRKLHDSVTDPKYDGVRTSRTQLYEDAGGDEGDDDDEEGGSFQDSETSQSDSGDNSDSEEAASDSVSSEDESEERSGFHQNALSEHTDTSPSVALANRTNTESPAHEDLASTLRQTREADRQKGTAVSRQIALWDTLLDARIQLQKTAAAANQLPTGTYLQHLASRAKTREALNNMLSEATTLSEELFLLQETLLERNEPITAPSRKRRKVDHGQGEPHDYTSHLRGLSADASALEANYHIHLIQTLAKWSAKVQAVAPSALLGSRTSFSGDKDKVGIVTMIDEVLRTDRDKLLHRTRTRRSKHKRLGSGDLQNESHEANHDEEEDEEVFDDLDFYQQLLRDVIKARGGEPQGGEQDWMTQQRERRAKRKSKVDTKASKGRKLRYEVHSKLQNFMVPVPVSHGAWHEEQVDGLFTSLLSTTSK